MRTATLAILIYLISLPAIAAKLAIIKSDRAILYSDVELKSPIGTLQKGTKIKIGERFRRQGMVAYTELQNKLIYIKVSDLLIQGSKSIKLEETGRFRAISLQEMKEEMKVYEHYFSLSGGVSTPGADWQRLANEMNANPNAPFYFIEGQIEHYFPDRKFAITGGGGYVQNSDPNLQLNMTTLFAKFHWIPINFKLAELHFFAGPTGSPWMVIQTENGQYQTKGSSIGSSTGTELRFFPGKKFTLAAGYDYQYFKVFRHDEIQLPGKYRNLTSLTKYSEARLYANLAVKF